MFGLEDKKYFGLDIGTSAIKIVEVRKSREGFRLAWARIAELDIDPINDDADKVKVVTRETLRRIVKEENIRSGVVAVSVSGQSVFMRSLKIPKVAKNKVDQIIQYEAQLQVPFPINEVIWDYEIFQQPESPEMEVALIAIKKEIVADVIREVESTGLDVDDGPLVDVAHHRRILLIFDEKFSEDVVFNNGDVRLLTPLNDSGLFPIPSLY